MSQYVRVYYSILDDERFVGVYNTPHLATWLRLLLVADAMWPATAFLPSGERAASVQALADRGLVELLGNGRYRMHGLDSERERRSASAAVGGKARQRSISERSANAQPTVSLAEQSRDEQSRAGERADLDAYLAVRFRPPTPAQRTLMDAYCQVFDATGPQRAADLIYRHPDDPIGALKADLQAFRAERSRQAAAQERPVPKRRTGSGLTGISAEIAKLVAADYAAEADHAAHHDAPHPRCPECRKAGAA